MEVEQDKTLPVISSLGLRDSNRGDWFVVLKPKNISYMDKEMIAQLKLRKDALGSWVWGQNGEACLDEKAALSSLIHSLGESEGGFCSFLPYTPHPTSLSAQLIPPP